MINFKYLKISDTIPIVLIIFSAFLYFVMPYIPEGIKTIDLYVFEIRSFAFPDFTHLVYYLKMKVLILSFSLIWFFTCKHWWKSGILVIVAIELAKVISSLNNEDYILDEIDYMTSLPITIPIIIVLFLISKRLNAYNLSMELRTKIDNEIDDVFYELNGIKNEEIIKLKKELNNVRKYKSTVEEEVYLKKLITIRNEYYKI